MKIDRLQSTAVRSSEKVERVTALGNEELQQIVAGVEPFSCAYLEGMTIKYHDGYPRAV